MEKHKSDDIWILKMKPGDRFIARIIMHIDHSNHSKFPFHWLHYLVVCKHAYLMERDSNLKKLGSKSPNLTVERLIEGF